jgi:hypothetical protein
MKISVQQQQAKALDSQSQSQSSQEHNGSKHTLLTQHRTTDNSMTYNTQQKIKST